MHEMSVAQSVLESVQPVLRERPGARLRKIGLRIGAWSGVDSGSLSFCFECLVKDTPWEGVGLEIAHCPVRRLCLRCQKEFTAEDFDSDCPRCGPGESRFAGGDELEVAYVELEEA